MPEFGGDVAIIWAKYLRLNKGCDSVGYAEIDAYCRLTGDNVNPWEIDLLIDLDVMRRVHG